jgi:hypothetical protein
MKDQVNSAVPNTASPSSAVHAGVEYLAPQTRMEEIVGMLNAYRQGWISYDKSHVQELQAERATLIRAAV